SAQIRTALGVQVSPRRPIWNVNRASEPGLGATECVPSGKWCKSTAFRHARVVQREPAVMPRSSQRRPYTPHRTRSVPASGALPDARTIFELLNAKRLKRPSASKIARCESVEETGQEFDSLSP